MSPSVSVVSLSPLLVVSSPPPLPLPLPAPVALPSPPQPQRAIDRSDSGLGHALLLLPPPPPWLRDRLASGAAPRAPPARALGPAKAKRSGGRRAPLPAARPTAPPASAGSAQPGGLTNRHCACACCCCCDDGPIAAGAAAAPRAGAELSI
jgi:hypothetical protein